MVACISQDAMGEARVYLATASAMGNLVVKPRRGMEQQVIAASTKTCISFLLDEGLWASGDGPSAGPLLDERLRVELLLSLGVEQELASSMANGLKKAELDALLGRKQPPSAA